MNTDNRVLAKGRREYTIVVELDYIEMREGGII